MRTVASNLSRRGNVARCGLPLWTSEATIGETFEDLHVAHYAGDVKIERHGRRAKYLGVRECRNVWECPICSDRVAREVGEQLRFAADKNRELGGANYTIALTIKHRSTRHELAAMVDLVNDGWRRVLSGAPWKRKVSEVGIRGYVRAVEITHGEAHGWHPHIHVALFTVRVLSQTERDELRAWISARWRRIVIRMTGSSEYTPNDERGVVLRPMYKTDYLAKFGLGGELAKAIVKRSHGEHRSPWDMLQALATGTGTDRERGLWREYTAAMYGHKQLTWSKGLKDLFGVEAGILERREAEAVEDGNPNEPETVLEMSAKIYTTAVYNTDLESECLRAAESGRPVEVIRRWFRAQVRQRFRRLGLAPPLF